MNSKTTDPARNEQTDAIGTDWNDIKTDRAALAFFDQIKSLVKNSATKEDAVRVIEKYLRR